MIDGFKKLVFITQKKSILQFNDIPLLHVSIKDNITAVIQDKVFQNLSHFTKSAKHNSEESLLFRSSRMWEHWIKSLLQGSLTKKAITIWQPNGIICGYGVGFLLTDSVCGLF